MFKVNNKDARTIPLASFWCRYCKLCTYFTLGSGVSIVNFEHLIAGWVILGKITPLLIPKFLELCYKLEMQKKVIGQILL